MLSGELIRRHPEGLPDQTIFIQMEGTGGQSFGAFLAKGITLYLIGDANDYTGKGMSGGRIAVRPSIEFRGDATKNIIVGNTVLYGATSGEAFFRGVAGERFAVRLSGATAVVEGTGDHGCEYMTGGVVVVLGRTGVNFAAGMSGGIAYVLDEDQLFDTKCNLEMVDIEPVTTAEDRSRLEALVRRHVHLTASEHAARILRDWTEMLPRFVKVMPIDYRRALERIRTEATRETEAMAITEEVYH
jgi:glutamate synthase (NADPH/NADH) large chain/glutamate synthase (ferredoxin)